MPSFQNDRLLRVINHLPVDRIPVWMMRQAGRTDPEYRKIREEDGRSLEDLFADVESSIKISLLPKRLGVDAIIMFQDILTPLTPMGAAFRFAPGPLLESPIRTMTQVQALKPLDPESEMKTVGAILKGLNQEIAGEMPVLGFAGSPMSLAFFMIAGHSPNKNIDEVMQFIEEQPEVTQALLDKLTLMTIDYLNYQIMSGAAAVQLFESFADVIPENIYQKYVQPTHEKIFSSLKPEAPSILFAKEFTDLGLMSKSGATVLSIGSCIDLQQARNKYPEVIFQGNVDNKILLNGSKEEITQAVKNCFQKSGHQNLICNLNHGLLADSPFENVQHFVNEAKKYGVVPKS